MMLVTLVENAIRHGINPLPRGRRGTDRRAHRPMAGCGVQVADTGRGLSESSGAGVGLANIRARLATLYGGDARLLLAQNPRARRHRDDRAADAPCAARGEGGVTMDSARALALRSRIRDAVLRRRARSVARAIPAPLRRDCAASLGLRLGPRQHARLVARRQRPTISRRRSRTSCYEAVLPMLLLLFGDRGRRRVDGARHAARRALRGRGRRGRGRRRAPVRRDRRRSASASCGCTMDRWPPGARSANMLPDSLLICGFIDGRLLLSAARPANGSPACDARSSSARTLDAANAGVAAAGDAGVHRARSSCSTRWRDVERCMRRDPRRRAHARRAHRLPARGAAASARHDVDRRKECELAHAYLNIQQLRAPPNAVRSTSTSAPTRRTPRMPPMVLLPLIDHAVRGGLDADDRGRRAARSASTSRHASCESGVTRHGGAGFAAAASISRSRAFASACGAVRRRGAASTCATRRHRDGAA